MSANVTILCLSIGTKMCAGEHSVDPDQTAPLSSLIQVCTVCYPASRLCHIVGQ